MSTDTSSRWAAGFGALAALVTGVLLAFRGGSPLVCLAVLPIAIGLVGSSFGRTWGVFATLGGAALILAAFGTGEVPAWAALVAVAGLAVVTAPLIRAFRFDAAAAAAWVAFASLSGGASALAWDELATPVAHAAPILDKPVADHGFEFRWSGTWAGERAERPCHHRRWHYR